MPTYDGGPAFARTPGTTGGPLRDGAEGMSLRDYFAAHCPEAYTTNAMTMGEVCTILGLPSANERSPTAEQILKARRIKRAADRYAYADAMLAQRTKE
jgi:hypothetical protein